MNELVDDLHNHAYAWKSFVGGNPGQRMDSNTEIWRKLGRIELATTAIHRPLIMEARNCFGESYNDLVSYIVSILQWSYAIDIISKGVPVAGNTSVYLEGLPKLQNYIWNWWQQDYYNQNNSDPLDSNLLLQEKNRWMSHAKKNNQNGFKQLSSTPLNMDDFERHIRYLLHIVDEGRAKDDPRIRSHRMNVVRIIPKSRREASFWKDFFQFTGSDWQLCIDTSSKGTRRPSQVLDRRYIRSTTRSKEAFANDKERNIGFEY